MFTQRNVAAVGFHFYQAGYSHSCTECMNNLSTTKELMVGAVGAREYLLPLEGLLRDSWKE